MNETTTTYVVHVTTPSPKEAGQIMRAAADRGHTDVRFSAVEAGERRPVNQDELGQILHAATSSSEHEATERAAADRGRAMNESIGYTLNEVDGLVDQAVAKLESGLDAQYVLASAITHLNHAVRELAKERDGDG